ncbi:DUF2514 domain-containing protein [Variovorax gossypii]
MTVRLIAAVLLTLTAVLGVRAWNAHLISEGDAQGAARTKGEWNAADLKRKAADSDAAEQAARDLAARQLAARQEEQKKQLEAERIANEQAQRESQLRQSLAAAQSRNRGLLDTITDLNTRAAAAMSSPGQDAGVVALIGQAATARELLGRCSSRYTAVAADADGLRLQVIGLQDFAASVLGVPQSASPAQ